MPVDSKRILVLYRFKGRANGMRASVRDHLHALDSSPAKHNVIYYNALTGIPPWLRAIAFDAVILHNTFLGMRWTPVFSGWKRLTDWINEWDCLKIAMPQDEYTFSSVLDDWLTEAGVSAVIGYFGAPMREILYPKMHSRARFYKGLTGYIDEEVAQACKRRIRPHSERPNDIVYRAKHLPFWYGSHGQIKHRVATVVAQRAKVRDLRCDISTNPSDVIFGDGWFDFLASGRVIIGCEGGSSVLDRRGEVAAKIRGMIEEDPDISFEEVDARMPEGWDAYEFFALGPRHFEAVITKTCQVLVEGEYDGIFQANRHYIPIKRDFSNVDEVLDMIQDENLTAEVAERAYNDIYLSGRYTYRTLASCIETAIDECGRREQRTSSDMAWYLGQSSARIASMAAGPATQLLRMLKKSGIKVG